MRAAHLLATIGSGLLGASLVACGPTPPPATPTASTGGGAAQVASGSGATDVSPVPEPGDVVLVARWKSPMATFGAVSSCAGLPAGALSEPMFRKVVVESFMKEEVQGLADPAGLANLVALNAPVDAVMTLDPPADKDKKRHQKNLPVAFSIGLTSLDGAKQAAGAQAELAHGVWKIGGKHHRGDLSCAIAAAAGPAPARLVCGPDDAAVAVLAPYLARTMAPSNPPPNDLHAEFRVKPIEARHGAEARAALASLPVFAQSELGIGEKKFDSALLDAASGLGEELVALLTDLDRVSVDFAVSPTTCVTASGALQLRGKKSWLAGTVLDRPERAGPPPALFWRVPKDADIAFFSRGADPSRYTAIVRTMRALVEGALTKYQVGSAADRKAASDLITIPLGKDTNTIEASGHFAPQAPKAGAQLTPQQKFDATVNASLGWHLIGVDEGPASLAKEIKDIVAVYNKAALLSALKKQLGNDAKKLPTLRSVPAPGQLGAGALDIEIRVADLPAGADAAPTDGKAAAGGVKKAAAAKPTVAFTGHLLLMADGNTTWLGFGANRDELVKRLLAAKSGSPDSGTLATREGLEALKSGKNMGGGFVTLGSFTKGLAATLGEFTDRAPGAFPAANALTVLNGLPHAGETPMLLSSQVSNGSAPALQTTLTVPKGAVEDLGAILVKAMTLAGPQGGARSSFQF